jgi:hypothetical protein
VSGCRRVGVVARNLALRDADPPTRRHADPFPPARFPWRFPLDRAMLWHKQISSRGRQAREWICDLQSRFDSLHCRAFEKNPGRLHLGIAIGIIK